MEAEKQKPNKLNQQKRQLWVKEQKHIKSLLITEDKLKCPKDQVRYIAGVDVSFSGKYENGACSALVIFDTKTRKVVYEDYQYVVLKEPYIPGFLAFRQLAPTLRLFEVLKTQRPEYWPDVVMVDGNGIVHKFQCGYACHLGVVLDLPTIGCAKTFYDIDGLHQSEVEDLLYENLQYEGEFMKLRGKSGREWCTAILTDEKQNKSLFVSQGHRISLNTATELALKYIKGETCEPVSIADRNSRKRIRRFTEVEYKNAPSYQMKYLSGN